MKRTFLVLTLAAQLTAAAAFAQTSDAADPAMPNTFGADWSTSLGAAMFSEGGTTVRPAAELSTQWQTLSMEDKTMIQRDCTNYMQHSGKSAGSTASDTAVADGTTPTTESGNTDGGTGGNTTAGAADTTAGAAPMMSVSMEQMAEICAATNGM